MCFAQASGVADKRGRTPGGVERDPEDLGARGLPWWWVSVASVLGTISGTLFWHCAVEMLSLVLRRIFTDDIGRRGRWGAVELDDPRVLTVPKLDETEYGRVSTVARAPVTPSTLRGMNTGDDLPEQQVLVGFLADPNGFNWASTLLPP